MKRVVVIGAGIGGLTAAARLAQAGLDVTVLESHIYPGGCAGTFFHQGYRFDAGATLAGGFAPGGPMARVAEELSLDGWPAHPAEPAMLVHDESGAPIARWADKRRWAARESAFGHAGGAFWRWQERTADALWDLALRNPPWPPQTLREGAQLVHTGLQWLMDAPTARVRPALIADALRPASVHLRAAGPRLRRFVDAQLLIAAQATSQQTVALYAAAALDLPRRGVVHLEGGMGAIAESLARSVRDHGGQVLLRHRATRIALERGRPVAVELRRGQLIDADIVIANLPPANIAALLGEEGAAALQLRRRPPHDGWGAFMTYLGVDEDLLPPDLPLHHQILKHEGLAEGASVFLSISPAWDAGRAPEGARALTLSTHTALGPWWELAAADRSGYEARKQAYMERMIDAAEQALPGLRDAILLALPGTPLTFQRFTQRLGGWVGGFPQTHLFRARGPRLAPDLWLVGDSIFPGQSTAAVALGGLRVARQLLADLGLQRVGSGASRRLEFESAVR